MDVIHSLYSITIDRVVSNRAISYNILANIVNSTTTDILSRHIDQYMIVIGDREDSHQIVSIMCYLLGGYIRHTPHRDNAQSVFSRYQMMDMVKRACRVCDGQDRGDVWYLSSLLYLLEQYIMLDVNSLCRALMHSDILPLCYSLVMEGEGEGRQMVMQNAIRLTMVVVKTDPPCLLTLLQTTPLLSMLLSHL